MICCHHRTYDGSSDVDIILSYYCRTYDKRRKTTQTGRWPRIMRSLAQRREHCVLASLGPLDRRQSIIFDQVDARLPCETQTVHLYQSAAAAAAAERPASWLHSVGDFSAAWRIDHQLSLLTTSPYTARASPVSKSRAFAAADSTLWKHRLHKNSSASD